MKKILTTVASLALMTGLAHSETYQATTWLSPTHILTSVGYVPFLADVKTATKGEVDFELYSSGSLVPAQTTLNAIGDGVAQLGLVATSYTPSELPVSGLINDLAFVAENDMATAFALTEIVLTNKRIQDEFAKHSTVALAGYSTPTYLMLCMRDVTDLNAVKGLKIRTAGTAQNEWVASLGAVPVAVTAADVYSGLERGSIDCTLTDPTSLETGLKLWEVVKSITMLEQGTSLGITYVYNKDFWSDIGSENRRKLLDLTARGVARTQIAYAQAVGKALKGSQERGLKINQPDASLVEALDKFRTNLVDTYPGRTAKERGVEDPTDVAKEFLDLQAKWTKLLEGTDVNNEEAVTKLLSDEIFSKIDENTFGL
jgi:TRAP-type C4-dicarboxylate transport system substrate-binding protein